MGVWDFVEDALPVVTGVGGAIVGGVVAGPAGAAVGYAGGTALGNAAVDAFGSDEGGAGTDPASYYNPAYDEYAAGIDARQKTYADRQGPQLDWSMANDDRWMAYRAREEQMALADEYKRVLGGQTPSQAEQQMRQGMVTANAQAQQLAATARGGAGNQLVAMQQAQRQGAMNALATNAQAGQLRAAEQERARAGLGSLLGDVRGGDLSTRAGSIQQTTTQGDQALRQQAANDAMVQMLENGRLAAMGAKQGAYGSAATAQAKAAEAEANRDAERDGAVVEAVGQGASLYLTQSEGEKNRQAMKDAAKPPPAPAPNPSPKKQPNYEGSGYGPY